MLVISKTRESVQPVKQEEIMKFKPDLEMIAELAEADDNLGICLYCGEVAGGVDPDAENYHCEFCGERRVFGAEQALLVL